MAKTGFRWVISPSKQLVPGLDRYGRDLAEAVKQISEKNGLEMQNYGRLNAKWTDRTGRARAGLFYQVNQKDNITILYFAHSVDYGIFLEVKPQYAIIWQTMEQQLSQIEKDLQAIFK